MCLLYTLFSDRNHISLIDVAETVVLMLQMADERIPRGISFLICSILQSSISIKSAELPSTYHLIHPKCYLREEGIYNQFSLCFQETDYLFLMPVSLASSSQIHSPWQINFCCREINFSFGCQRIKFKGIGNTASYSQISQL